MTDFKMVGITLAQILNQPFRLPPDLAISRNWSEDYILSAITEDYMWIAQSSLVVRLDSKIVIKGKAKYTLLVKWLNSQIKLSQGYNFSDLDTETQEKVLKRRLKVVFLL